eukprot:CAMPEP_0172517970 /NCGR_PEP_ID=MMETSP1066-20121228/289365_1 /TAXON_ID=671091 /ORGANISM="Coscinodiscus wailesii, Strain CCMP2513" /LENGTH=842 /DNA_ID=CAMNT_0013300217 /DNA_START=551 /DNA_END=3079 /DNA_ORIENTATION=+
MCDSDDSIQMAPVDKGDVLSPSTGDATREMKSTTSDSNNAESPLPKLEQSSTDCDSSNRVGLSKCDVSPSQNSSQSQSDNEVEETQADSTPSRHINDTSSHTSPVPVSPVSEVNAESDDKSLLPNQSPTPSAPKVPHFTVTPLPNSSKGTEVTTTTSQDRRVGAPLPAPPKAGEGAVRVFSTPTVTRAQSISDHRRSQSCAVDYTSLSTPRRNPFDCNVDAVDLPLSAPAPRTRCSTWSSPISGDTSGFFTREGNSPTNCSLEVQYQSHPCGSEILSPTPVVPPGRDAVMLGVEQLERQQAEREARKAAEMPQLSDRPSGSANSRDVRVGGNIPATSFPGSFDIFNGGAVAPAPRAPLPPPYPQNREDIDESNDGGADKTSRHSSLSRFLTPLRLRGYSNNSDDLNLSRKGHSSEMPGPVDASDEEENIWRNHAKPLVYGYLHKRTRNGVWQRRFFETDGESLTYYKTQKRSKLLATLDLVKVGEIAVVEADPTCCTFTIQVAGRPYYLKADDSATCKDWVINLNRVREARVQIGGIKLVTRNSEIIKDATIYASNRKHTDSAEYTARIVMIANRQRCHAIDNGDNDNCLKQMVITASTSDSPTGGQNYEVTPLCYRSVAQDTCQQGTTNDTTTPSTNHAPSLSRATGVVDIVEKHTPVGVRPPAPARIGVSLRSPRLSGHLPPEIYARWRKPRSNFTDVRGRLRRFLLWVSKVRCYPRGSSSMGSLGSHSFDGSEKYRNVNISQTNSTTVVDFGGASDLSSVSGARHASEVDTEDSRKKHSAWVDKEQQLQREGSVSSQTSSFQGVNVPIKIMKRKKSLPPKHVTGDNLGNTVDETTRTLS